MIYRSSSENFNPRSPRRERHGRKGYKMKIETFQSTLPEKGATMAISAFEAAFVFQSTLPEKGATSARA